VLGGFGTGLLVETREGRPTKVEGNPDHPASLGAAGVFEQASVLQLYDPDRARRPNHRGRPRTWLDFTRDFGPVSAGSPDRGAGLRFLLEPTASPLTAELIARVRDAYPEARFYFHAPLPGQTTLEGARLALGRALQPIYDVAAADVVLSLDADFLASGPFNLRYARHFADRRRNPERGMNRLYAVEGTPGITGASADHRLRVRTGEVRSVLEATLAEVVRGSGLAPPGFPESLRREGARPGAGGDRDDWIRAVARDLRAHAGACLVVAGERQPAPVHALAHLLNAALGNIGRTVRFTGSPLVDAGEPNHSLEALAGEIRAGQVRTLLILGGNPAYTAPADLEFARLIESVPESVHLGLYENETARRCTWFLPELHYLEAWGDARACDGTASIVQPLIAPLYGGHSVDDVLSVFLGADTTGQHERLRESWRRRVGEAEFETFWEETLRRGVVPGTALPAIAATPAWENVLPLLAATDPGMPAEPGSIELTFREDASTYDGRFGNNPWLQELPDPVTKLTWDNAALLSAGTAARLGVRTEDVIEVEYRGRALRIPALVVPGHAEDAITLPLGYGRTGSEAVARGVGANAYAIRTSDAPCFGAGARVRRVVERGHAVTHRLARTQMHGSMQGRPIVLQAALEEYRADPDFTRRQAGRTLSLYRPYEYAEGNQWAMTIDLGVCTGCSACVVACQAENNTPVVGKEGVLKGREMHWLRVDRYFAGDAAQPDVVFQPMLCQHCEQAPCEYVCPVNATVHGPDGLNEMVYNRCIGTRFCSNNCPYKVRRFNWFDYNTARPETARMQLNPDVTVRARGVMEKCTYCVQRIRRAEITAQMEGRPVRTDEVRTACQQACPTRAIVFGSLTDPQSEVARTRAQPRIYSVLHELGTEPRTRYLARITNPNAELGAAPAGAAEARGLQGGGPVTGGE